MIYISAENYPMSGNDLMDSAVRISILNFYKKQPLLNTYENNGILVRCPVGYPSDNPKNCSRDQILMLVAAYHHNNETSICRLIFKACAKRFFFAQNTERDIPGSTKYPWPHSFWKDSVPDTVRESRVFDSADPLLPHHIGGLIISTKLYILYPFLLLSLPFLLIELLFPSKDLDKEQNQLIALCSVYGDWALKLYKLRNPNYIKQLNRYWGLRNEIEYANILIDFVERK